MALGRPSGDAEEAEVPELGLNQVECPGREVWQVEAAGLDARIPVFVERSGDNWFPVIEGCMRVHPGGHFTGSKEEAAAYGYTIGKAMADHVAGDPVLAAAFDRVIQNGGEPTL